MNTQVSQTGFNGEFSDPVLHQYILGNGYRAYNPALQRFTSPDSLSPFGKGGINPYIYCEGDPINRTDPTGHGPALWAIDLIDFGMMFVKLDKESTIVGGAEMKVGRKTKRAAEDTALDEGVSPKRPRGDGGIDNPIATSSLGGPVSSKRQKIDGVNISQLEFQEFKRMSEIKNDRKIVSGFLCRIADYLEGDDDGNNMRFKISEWYYDNILPDINLNRAYMQKAMDERGDSRAWTDISTSVGFDRMLKFRDSDDLEDTGHIPKGVFHTADLDDEYVNGRWPVYAPTKLMESDEWDILAVMIAGCYI